MSYRRATWNALIILLLFEVGGFLIAYLLGGATLKDLAAGIGVELIGAVVTAAAVVEIERWNEMGQTRKYGDATEKAFMELKQELATLKAMLTPPDHVGESNIRPNPE